MSLKLAAQASLANDPAPKICRRSYTAVSVFCCLAPGKPKPQILDENPRRLSGVGASFSQEGRITSPWICCPASTSRWS